MGFLGPETNTKKNFIEGTTHTVVPGPASQEERGDLGHSEESFPVIEVQPLGLHSSLMERNGYEKAI